MKFIQSLLKEYDEHTSYNDHLTSQHMQHLVAYVKNYIKGNVNIRVVADAAYQVLTTLPTSLNTITKQYNAKDLHGVSQSEEYKKANQQYKQNIEQIIQYITKSDKWDKSITYNSGSWAHFVKKGNKPNSDKTYKWYGTIKDRSSDAIKIIANMLYDLDKVDFMYQVQLKVPGSYMSYLSHPDSIVIHYRGPEDKEKLVPVIQKYKKYFGDREKLGRQDFGVDDKSFRMDSEDRGDDNSDSMIVAKKFAQTISKNADQIKQIYSKNNEQEIAKQLLSILLKISKESSHRQ